MEPVQQEVVDMLLPFAKDNSHVLGLFKNETPRQLNYIFARILEEMKCPPFVHFNLYDLVKIQWGDHPQYNTYQFIDSPVICVWGGYNELANRSLEDMGIDFLVRRMARSSGTTVVLLRKGKYATIEAEADKVTTKVIDLAGALNVTEGKARRNV